MKKPKIASQKKLYNFRTGDLVEWIDGNIKHEGEILGNAGIYKTIEMDGERIRQVMRVRANYFQVKDFADDSIYIIYGSRLKKTKIKVEFN